MRRKRKGNIYSNACSKRGRIKDHRTCGISTKQNKIIELNPNVSVVKMNVITS